MNEELQRAILVADRLCSDPKATGDQRTLARQFLREHEVAQRFRKLLPDNGPGSGFSGERLASPADPTPPRSIWKRLARWAYMRAYMGALEAIGARCRRLAPTPQYALGAMDCLKALDLLADGPALRAPLPDASGE